MRSQLELFVSCLYRSSTKTTTGQQEAALGRTLDDRSRLQPIRAAKLLSLLHSHNAPFANLLAIQHVMLTQIKLRAQTSWLISCLSRPARPRISRPLQLGNNHYRHRFGFPRWTGAHNQRPIDHSLQVLSLLKTFSCEEISGVQGSRLEVYVVSNRDSTTPLFQIATTYRCLQQAVCIRIESKSCFSLTL